MDVGRVGRVGVGGAEAYPRVDDTDLAFGSRDARGFERGDEALQRLFFALLLVRLQPREERLRTAASSASSSSARFPPRRR